MPKQSKSHNYISNKLYTTTSFSFSLSICLINPKTQNLLSFCYVFFNLNNTYKFIELKIVICINDLETNNWWFVVIFLFEIWLTINSNLDYVVMGLRQ